MRAPAQSTTPFWIGASDASGLAIIQKGLVGITTSYCELLRITKIVLRFSYELSMDYCGENYGNTTGYTTENTMENIINIRITRAAATTSACAQACAQAQPGGASHWWQATGGIRHKKLGIRDALCSG